MRHSTMGLTRCYKTAVFLHLYLQFFYLSPQLWYQYSDFKNKCVELYFRFRLWRYCRHRHVIRHRPTNFCPN